MDRIENEETQLSVRSVRCQEKEESQKKSLSEGTEKAAAGYVIIVALRRSSGEQ